MVHVVPSVYLRGAAVTTPVMRNDAKALGKKEQHLIIPVIRRKRPPVVKHNWLSIPRTPVFVENLCAIFRRNGWHGVPFIFVSGFIEAESERQHP